MQRLSNSLAFLISAMALWSCAEQAMPPSAIPDDLSAIGAPTRARATQAKAEAVREALEAVRP